MTNKNSLDVPGAVKKTRTAGGVVSQMVPGKVSRPPRTAKNAK